MIKRKVSDDEINELIDIVKSTRIYGNEVSQLKSIAASNLVIVELLLRQNERNGTV